MIKNYNYYLVGADISRFAKKQAGANFRAGASCSAERR